MDESSYIDPRKLCQPAPLQGPGGDSFHVGGNGPFSQPQVLPSTITGNETVNCFGWSQNSIQATYHQQQQPNASHYYAGPSTYAVPQHGFHAHHGHQSQHGPQHQLPHASIGSYVRPQGVQNQKQTAYRQAQPSYNATGPFNYAVPPQGYPPQPPRVPVGTYSGIQNHAPYRPSPLSHQVTSSRTPTGHHDNTVRPAKPTPQRVPKTDKPRAPALHYTGLKNPEMFPLHQVQGLGDGATLNNMRAFMHTSTGPIIQVTADIDYPPTPPPTDVDDASSTQGTTEPSDIHRVAKHISPPFRYEKILIQDPEIIEAMDIRRWQRELGDKPKISSKDTFKLYPVGGREAMVGIVGSPRHTYINWWELAGRENRVPEWQEVMHVAAELGRDVKEVHEEILEYMRSFSGRGAGTGL